MRFLSNLLSRPRVALAAAATVLLLCGINQGHLRLDSLTYAGVGKTILVSGTWDRLAVGSCPYFNKPPLLFWANAVSFAWFGFNETAARLPSVLSGGCFLVLLFAWLRRRGIGPAPAALAVGAALVSPLFLEHIQACRMEGLFLCGLMLGVLASDRTALPGRTRFGLLGGGTAVAWLAKGPAAALFTPIWVMMRVRDRSCGRLGPLSFLAAHGVGLLPVILWWSHQSRLFDSQTMGNTARREVGMRILRGLGRLPEHALYYPREALIGFVPLVVLAGVTAWLLRQSPARRPAPAGGVKIGRVELGWLAVTIVALLPMHPRAARYLLPLLPLVVLVAATLLEQLEQVNPVRFTRRATAILWAAAGAGIVIGLSPLQLHRPMPENRAEILAALRARPPASGDIPCAGDPWWETRAFFWFYTDTDLITVPKIPPGEERQSPWVAIAPDLLPGLDPAPEAIYRIDPLRLVLLPEE